MRNTMFHPMNIREALYVTSHCNEAEAFVLDIAIDIIAEKLKDYKENREVD